MKASFLLMLIFAANSLAEPIVYEVQAGEGSVGKRSYYGKQTWGVDGTGSVASGTLNFGQFKEESGKYRVRVDGVLEADGRAKYVFFIDGVPVRDGLFPLAGEELDCEAKGQAGEFVVGRFEVKKGAELSLWISSVYPCGKRGAYGLTESLKFEAL